jgi:O-antigen/teichoic acid export membrane protein
MTYVVAHCFQAWYVFRRCPELFPRFSEYRFGVYREVLLLGGQFLVLELTYLLIFMTDRMIALRYLGPEVATEYDIVLRFVGLVTTGYSMVIGPMWSLAGASWAKRDLVGLRMLRRIVLWVMIPFWIGAVVLALVMNELIRRWIDPTISLDRSMLVLVVIYAWTVIWCGAHASLLNGIGRVREQMICGVLACFINVPLAIYLCGFESLGGGGILLASIVSLSLFGVVGPLVWRDCQRGLEN